jgi:outer membrane protein TolC
MRTSNVLLLAGALTAGVPAAGASAQERLSLQDAIGRTLESNPAIRATTASERIAAQEVVQARAGWLPRVDYVESWQRSNQPVFVFGSLLGQSRFGAENFAIDALNHPDAVTHARGALVAQQAVFDPSLIARVRSARLSHQLASIGGEATRRELVLATTRAYGQVLVAGAARRAADAAVRAATEDRRRAADRREAGLATDADVLAFDVHASAMTARMLQASGDERVARGVLNDLIGAPLDAAYALDDVAPGAGDYGTIEALEREALERRDRARQAALQEQVAATARATARAAFLPSVSFQGGWEFDGKNWSGRQTWWVAGVEMRWNLFNGLADRARLEAATHGLSRAAAERARTENAIRLDVRTAVARLDAARAREATSRTAVEQAREAQRIIRERYDAGMAGVVDALRAANALLDAEAQRTSALVDLFVSEATLKWALGR